MGRTPCCNAGGVKKGAWTADEDEKLIAYIKEHGEGGWRTLPQKAGLSRCGKSCRLRWTNYLRPDIKRGELNPEEEQYIIKLHATLGNRWSAIAKHLPRRTDNEIKNYWNTHLKKRLTKMGIDPTTHKPIDPTSLLSSSSTSSSSSSSSTTPISRSAQLLNRVATKLAPSGCLETVQSMVSSLATSAATTTTTTTEGVDNYNDDSDPDVVDITDMVANRRSTSTTTPEPKSSSTSAKLLNKMATRLGAPRNGISSTLKSILSSRSDKVGQTDCDTVGAASTDAAELGFLEDVLEGFDDWEVFFGNECGGGGGGGGGGISDVSYNMESPSIYLNDESTVMPEFDSFGSSDNENEAFIPWEWLQQDYTFDQFVQIPNALKG